MISVFIDASLIVRPVNPPSFINIEFHFFQKRFRRTWVNIHSGYVQYFGARGLYDFLKFSNEIFLWHFIRVDVKDIIPGRDTFMIGRILTKVIERASEHTYTIGKEG